MQNKFAAITMIMMVMIGMTGMASAVTTTVAYDGDGSYSAEFNGNGEGSLSIRTLTSNGYDMLGVGYNDGVSGYQDMSSDAEWTRVERDVTTGGTISTYTSDDDGNCVTSYARSSMHVNTNQNVRFGVGIDTDIGNANGVEAYTVISGTSPGEEYVTGAVRAVNDDAYVYTGIYVSSGAFVLDTLAGAGNTSDYDGVGIYVDDVSADDMGVFKMGAGTDGVFMYVEMEDDAGGVDVWSESNGETVTMVAWFDGNFNANGYIYAIESPV